MNKEWNRKRSKEEYLNCDMLGDDMDVDIKLRKVTISKIRKPQTCFGVYGSDQHDILPGTMVQRDSALLDGLFGVSYICLDCLDKMLDDENNDEDEYED